MFAFTAASLLEAGGDVMFDRYQCLAPKQSVSGDIVVVDIDDESLRRIGQWPWSRDALAHLVGNLHGGAALGLDILLSEPDRRSQQAPSDPDAMLSAALHQIPSVLAEATASTPDPPLPILRDAARATASVAATRDADGVLRRLPAMRLFGDTMQPDFAADLVRLAHPDAGIALRTAAFGQRILSIGGHNLAADAQGQVIPRFAPVSAVRHIPAWQILSATADPALWQGKIVLVGVDASGLDAGFQTPLGIILDAVDVQAELVETLLTGDSLSRPPWARLAELVLAMALSLGSAWLFGRLRKATFWLLQIVLALGMIAASFALFAEAGLLLNWTLPMAVLAVANIGLLGLFALGERRRRLQQEHELHAALAAAEAAQRENALREAAVRADQSLRIALNAARLGMWDCDLLTGQSQRSPRHDEIFGVDAAQPWGRDAILARVAPEERAAMVRRFDEAEQTGILHDSCTIIRPDGTRAAIVLDGRISRDAGGALTRMSGVVADVTEHRQLEARLHEAEKQRSIGLIAGGVAHQFNNLLTVIVGNIEAAIDDPGLSPRARSGLDAAMSAVNAGATVTQQLLSFARRQYLRPQHLQTDEILHAFTGVLELSLNDDIVLVTDIPDGLWPMLIDRTAFELALLNLCLNARDAMPIGGRLHIAASNQTVDDTSLGISGAFVEIAVSDTGRGVDPALLSQVFEPFLTTKPEGEGVGLGLSQVHGFAHQSGGTVVLESVAGEGTTVRLFLPAAEQVGGASAVARPA